MKRLPISLITLFAVVPAVAQAQGRVEAGQLNLEGWTYEPLYAADTWSIEATFGANVYGQEGAAIGDVEDLVMNDSGEVVALIAEVGGLWDIGDTHISVPWDQVTITEDQRIEIPVTEASIDQFDLFETSGLPPMDVEEDVVEGVDDQPLRLSLWRASDLIGDYVRVMDEESGWLNFGYVQDILVTDAQISATVVRTTGSYGPDTYAYPFSGRSAAPAEEPTNGASSMYWIPGSPTYDLPLLVGDATGLPSFDRDRVESN